MKTRRDHPSTWLRTTRKVAAVAVACLTLLQAAPARAALVTQELDFVASDGVALHAMLGGEGSIVARPVIVEFSPYAPGLLPSDGRARTSTTSRSTSVARA